MEVSQYVLLSHSILGRSSGNINGLPLWEN